MKIDDPAQHSQAFSERLAPAVTGSKTMTFFHYLVAGLLLAAWSIAMAIDEPPYTIVRTQDAFEVRQYEPLSGGGNGGQRRR